MLRQFSSYRTSAGKQITLVKLDKSGGCVDRDDEFMRQSREASIREYFFGDPKRILSPHYQQVSFDEAVIYKVREGMPVPYSPKKQEGCLDTNNKVGGAVNLELSAFVPRDHEEEVAETELYEKTEPSSLMQHCVMAVMYASSLDTQETIRDAPVMGFVYVAEVDEKKRRLKILAPLNTRITDRPMVWGSWPEAMMSLIG